MPHLITTFCKLKYANSMIPVLSVQYIIPNRSTSESFDFVSFPSCPVEGGHITLTRMHFTSVTYRCFFLSSKTSW